MRVIKELGACIITYIIARIIISAIVPQYLATMLVLVANIIVVLCVLVSIVSLVLGGNPGLMMKIRGICVSAIVLCIAAVFVINGLHIDRLFTNNDSAYTPSPTVQPVSPSPTDDKGIVNPPTETPTISPSPTPVPTQTPSPTVTPTPINPPSARFLMSEDNYSFPNSKNSFGYSATYKIPLERYQMIFTPVSAQTYYNSQSSWGGSCFGFSVTSTLFNTEELTPSEYQGNAVTAYNFNTPKNPDRPLTQLIELYQISFSLDDVWKSCNANRNDYMGLINSVDGKGLIIYLNATGAYVHAVVAYDVRKVSSGVYDISIYDNNHPNDRNRKMRLDINNNAWSYYCESFGINCGSKPEHYFSYIPASIIDTAVDNALKSTGKGASNTKIIIPKSAQITKDSVLIHVNDSIYEIAIPEYMPGAPENTTSVWDIPDGSYDINLSSPGGNVVFFNDEMSLVVETDNETIHSEIENSELSVESGKGKIDITYMTNDTVDKPLIVNGQGALTAQIKDGHLILTGNAEVEISRNGKTIITNVTAKPIIADKQMDSNAFPLWLMVLFAALFITAVVIVIVKRKSIFRRF